MKKSYSKRIGAIATILLLLGISGFTQNSNQDNADDPLSFGVVLDDPAMKNVIVNKDITYFRDDSSRLNLDIYTPPRLKAGDRLPAIIFLNAIGDNPGQRKVKTWGIYSSWPKLMAANSYIGISMEMDGNRIQECLQELFNFLDKKGSSYNIDKDKLGVYAASANVSQSVNYLMGDKAYRGIRAAVLYYGGAPGGPFRKDLPVLFVVSEGDVARNGYSNLWNEVLKNNAPWTIKMGTGMPHAFDAFSDNNEARKIIKETISFWKVQLDPVRVPSFAHSRMRDVLGLLRMNTPGALELLKSMAEEQPGNIRILSFYGDVLKDSKKFDEARSVYQKILALQSDNIQALLAMAVLSYAEDKTGEAEKYVSAAVKTGKVTYNSYGDLGFSLLVAGKDKEAAKYYEQAVALRPNGHDFYNLACAYAKYGEKDRALAALDKSLEFGYNSRQLFENDEDLVSLRTDERFKAILSKTK